MNTNQSLSSIIQKHLNIAVSESVANDIMSDIVSARIVPVTPNTVSLAAQKIKERRIKLNVTQNELASMLNITDNTLRTYEKSNYLEMSLRHLLLIWRMLNLREGIGKNAELTD